MKYFFFLFFASTLIAQVSATPNKQSKANSPAERIVTKDELVKASIIRDLVPSFSSECKILDWEIIFTTPDGTIKILDESVGKGLQKFLRSREWRSLYISLGSTCPMDVQHSFKIIVKG